MIETNETPEDVERRLAQARKAVQDFEDSVDYRRLFLRLRTASPAHPILLARFLFGGLSLLCVLAGILVMVITVVNSDLARALAKFEAVIPHVPEGIPALPAVLGVLALCMAIAWAMATGAALAIGRDAQMLPWEQKKLQALVNEVTRLTTQKAVMERIRSTPAGARPRIATPVPVSLRSRANDGGGLASRADGGGGFARTPGPAPTYLDPSSSASSAAPSSPASPGGFGRTPVYAPPAAPTASAAAPLAAAGGLAARARASAARPSSDGSGAHGFAPVSSAASPQAYSAPHVPANVTPEVASTEPEDLVVLIEEEEVTVPEPHAGDTRRGGTGGVRLGMSHEEPAEEYGDLITLGQEDSAQATPEAGILAKARAGALGLRPTPDGSAGRVRPGRAGHDAARARLASADGSPETPRRPRKRAGITGGMFGAPLSVPRSPQPGVLPLEDTPDAVEVLTAEEDVPTLAGGRLEQVQNRRIPAWGPIRDPWLREALHKSEALVSGFPIQAHIEFSEEPNLPFTLVIARATPAMAVRAMVNFVEFLAGIPTPPRARIELVNVAHLDRSFHKNVEAALEPYFGNSIEVEPNPGRVDIQFTDPDPGWGAYPLLPME